MTRDSTATPAIEPALEPEPGPDLPPALVEADVSPLVPDEKDLTVELDWSDPVEELDLSVRDRNGQPISGLIASGSGGKTFTTRQPVTVSEVRIEVDPTTHAARYEVVVEVD